MKSKRPAKIKTFEQAFEFVLKVKTCLIFGSKTSDLPSLWDVVDLPGRQPGQPGWGAKVEAVWAWKNELPAQFPDEIFYGKLPGGLAVLMDMEHLRQVHYPAHHRPVSSCSPHTTAGLRKALSPSGAISKSKVDSALVELQVTLNIIRSNAPNLKRDTWLPFAEQYPDIGGEA